MASRLGIDLVAPKIPALIRQVDAALAGGKPPVVVFCWRGGMRSRALTSFLELAGIPARQLQGGHKAFRARVREFFETGEWGRLLVLRGLTGVGKTRLLLRLRDEGYPVLDLEGLANHRGSAFGALGLPPQPARRLLRRCSGTPCDSIAAGRLRPGGRGEPAHRPPDPAAARL